MFFSIDQKNVRFPIGISILLPTFVIPLCQSVDRRTFVNVMVLLKLSSNIEFSQNLKAVKMFNNNTTSFDVYLP